MFAEKNMENKEMIAAFALSRIFCYEPRLARTIVDTIGASDTIFSLDRDTLTEVMGPFNKYKNSILGTRLENVAEELERILGCGYNYIWYGHPAFPQSLAFCEDAPVGFFLRSGDTPENVFRDECISMVGTRDMTSYGREWCRRLTESLGRTRERPTIVSGLAYGIDVNSHIGALENGLPTIAVLGNGIDTIYPPGHSKIAGRICETPGCGIISEYPPSACVNATNFLSRNRIIAGLSKATVLVESRLKGGGMTTARQAFSYGREVYAVPGRNDDIFSQGCNSLIQEHLAEPLTSCESFLGSLGYTVVKRSGYGQKKADEFYSGNMDRQNIQKVSRMLLLIRNNRGISATDIADRLDIQFAEAISLLARLESDGFIDMDFLQRCSIKTV